MRSSSSLLVWTTSTAATAPCRSDEAASITSISSITSTSLLLLLQTKAFLFFRAWWSRAAGTLCPWTPTSG